MRVAILFCCLSLSAALRAAETDKQTAIQDLGAVLAWRLGPEAIEGWCRNADPDGAAARKAALDSWRQKMMNVSRQSTRAWRKSCRC